MVSEKSQLQPPCRMPFPASLIQGSKGSLADSSPRHIGIYNRDDF
jgi:hypothetical protein